MPLKVSLAFIITILMSIVIVAIIILLGWFLIWKAFLSKFRLVRELIGHQEDDDLQLLEDTLLIQQTKPRKVRRD